MLLGLLFYNLDGAVFFILYLLLVNRLSLYDYKNSSCRASGSQISESVYYQSKPYNRDATIKVNSQNVEIWLLVSSMLLPSKWLVLQRLLWFSIPYVSEKLGLEVGRPFHYMDIVIEKSIRFLYSFWPNQLKIHQLIVHR